MTATFYVGDAIEVMGKLPEKSVDLILTSPPFLALRSYLPADHPDKALEGGSQATPGEFIDWLLDVVEACARVLAPHGSLCFELGDTYSGSGGAGGDYAEGMMRDGQPAFIGSARTEAGSRYGADPKRKGTSSRGTGGPAWPLAKSLSLIPESFRWAMVYGHNPFTGRTTAPWRLRNVIRWVRPNPPVGALGDKFRPATSELMVFCKSAKRYFDLDAVRTAHVDGRLSSGGGSAIQSGIPRGFRGDIQSNPVGAPPLDWWEHDERNHDDIPTRSTPETSTVEVAHSPTTPSPMGETARALVHPLEGELVWRCSVHQSEAPHDKARCWYAIAKLNDRSGSNPSGCRIVKARLIVHSTQSAGVPPLDWWNIPPGGYPGAHYAVWPPELLIKPIKAMTPERVCRTCGEPSRRIVGEAEYTPSATYRGGHTNLTESARVAPGVNQFVDGGQGKASLVRQAPTLGFSDCGHDDYRPGMVLDCFAGSGTTLAVATGHGRDAIGIDLDARNYDLALDRVGPFILTRGAA